MPNIFNNAVFRPQPRGRIIRELMTRSRSRLSTLSEETLDHVLQDALYSERRRLERDTPKPGEVERLDTLARALIKGDRSARADAGLDLVRHWSDEIHGHFNPRIYKFATKMLPRLITGLLSRRTAKVRSWDFSPNRRIKILGDTKLLQDLSHEGTLVLVPTHVSNLDSPMLGLALHMAGLPPFVYGAGLNLFSNPVMGYFLSRLGAYTVDRKKKSSLYKEVLKDYSTQCISMGYHSIFFPGGTRSRSGKVEQRLKKGLMGTGIAAWQEMRERDLARKNVFFVPVNLTFQLVLEAKTLIEDHLEETGKQRYIISDDESADAKVMAHFARRVLDLDSSVVVHFGDPLDPLGNRVSKDANARKLESEHRLGFVSDRAGQIEHDPQRDRVYTRRLAHAIRDAYGPLTHVMGNHLVARVAWTFLEEHVQSRDPFRIIRAGTLQREVPKALFLERLQRAIERVRQGAAQGEWHTHIIDDAPEILQSAVDRFSRFHTLHAVNVRGDSVVVEDPALCLYYQNRLVHLDLEFK